MLPCGVVHARLRLIFKPRGDKSLILFFLQTSPLLPGCQSEPDYVQELLLCPSKAVCWEDNPYLVFYVKSSLYDLQLVLNLHSILLPQD